MKRIFIFIFFIVFINAKPVKYIPILMGDITMFIPDSTLSFGLVAHYKFEGNTKDSSGNGNHGFSHGGIKYSTGIIGKAANFDGINDYVDVNPKSNVSKIQDFTITVWTYFTPKDYDQGRGSRHYIFDGHSWSKDASNNIIFKDGINLIYDTTPNKEEIHNAISVGYGNYNELTELDTLYNLKNRWIQMSFVRKGTKNSTYINGKLIHSDYYRQNITDEILNMQHKWHIGTFSANNKNYYHSENNYSYKGKIDDLRIYNRALDRSEIQQLYRIRKN